MTDRNDKLEQLVEIEDRIENGWNACESEPDPAKQQRYTDVWLRLMGQYQQLNDDLFGTEGKYTVIPRPGNSGR